MNFITMAFIFAGVLIGLVLLVLAINNRSKNAKPKKQKTPKEKKQKRAKATAGGLIVFTGIADFFLYQKVGIAILVGVSLIVTIIVIVILQTAGGGVKTVIANFTKSKPKGPYIDEDGNYHPDPNYKFDPNTDPIIGFREEYYTEDEFGNLVDDEGTIISPAGNLDNDDPNTPRII